MIPRIVLLIMAGLAFILLAGLPARYLAGDVAFLHCATAELLCLLPALVTLAWVEYSYRRDPQQGALIALGGSGIRMFVVLALAVLLRLQVPLYRDFEGFLFWVLAAYLYTLAVEIVLLVVGRHPQPSAHESRTAP